MRARTRGVGRTKFGGSVKRLLIALLVLGGLRVVVAYVRRFADPDPSLYGHPRQRA